MFVDWRAAMEAAGFDDSKALTEQERERLFQRMTEVRGVHANERSVGVAVTVRGVWLQTEQLGWIIDELSADYISHSMLRASHPVSLNVTSHDTVIDMIRCIRSHGYHVQCSLDVCLCVLFWQQQCSLLKRALCPRAA